MLALNKHELIQRIITHSHNGAGEMISNTQNENQIERIKRFQKDAFGNAQTNNFIPMNILARYSPCRLIIEYFWFWTAQMLAMN